MNTQLDTLKLVLPAVVVGGLLSTLSFRNLESKDELSYQPNPLALGKSPYGRTVGMALQGPVNRFWDRGVGAVESKATLAEASTPDAKLFNWVTELREEKSSGSTPEELHDVYQDYTMARIEKKLELGWKMDPRNFANYAIYQMFLWEGFNKKLFTPALEVRELSLATLEVSLEDGDNPVSLLTAGQAAYDLIFEARTSRTQSKSEAADDIETYAKVLPQIISDYDSLVASMQADGRWNNFTEVKKGEFSERRRYLEHLKNETKTVIENLSQLDSEKEGQQS